MSGSISTAASTISRSFGPRWPTSPAAPSRGPGPSPCRLREPSFSQPIATGVARSPKPCCRSNSSSASTRNRFSRCTRMKSTSAIAAALAFAALLKPASAILERICASCRSPNAPSWPELFALPTTIRPRTVIPSAASRPGTACCRRCSTTNTSPKKMCKRPSARR